VTGWIFGEKFALKSENEGIIAIYHFIDEHVVK
jgi:hypothetical protein